MQDFYLFLIMIAIWGFGYIFGYAAGDKKGNREGYRNGKAVARNKFWSE